VEIPERPTTQTGVKQGGNVATLEKEPESLKPDLDKELNRAFDDLAWQSCQTGVRRAVDGTIYAAI
jgi:hypothetical protein